MGSNGNRRKTGSKRKQGGNSEYMWSECVATAIDGTRVSYNPRNPRAREKALAKVAELNKLLLESG